MSISAKQAVNLDNGFLIFISDGDVTVNFETSNGHTIAIGEEAIQEDNAVKASGDNGTLSEKPSGLEGNKEDEKGKWTHLSFFFPPTLNINMFFHPHQYML